MQQSHSSLGLIEKHNLFFASGGSKASRSLRPLKYRPQSNPRLANQSENRTCFLRLGSRRQPKASVSLSADNGACVKSQSGYLRCTGLVSGSVGVQPSLCHESDRGAGGCSYSCADFPWQAPVGCDVCCVVGVAAPLPPALRSNSSLRPPHSLKAPRKTGGRPGTTGVRSPPCGGWHEGRCRWLSWGSQV